MGVLSSSEALLGVWSTRQEGRNACEMCDGASTYWAPIPKGSSRALMTKLGWESRRNGQRMDVETPQKR